MYAYMYAYIHVFRPVTESCHAARFLTSEERSYTPPPPPPPPPPRRAGV